MFGVFLIGFVICEFVLMDVVIVFFLGFWFIFGLKLMCGIGLFVMLLIVIEIGCFLFFM